MASNKQPACDNGDGGLPNDGPNDGPTNGLPNVNPVEALPDQQNADPTTVAINKLISTLQNIGMRFDQHGTDTLNGGEETGNSSSNADQKNQPSSSEPSLPVSYKSEAERKKYEQKFGQHADKMKAKLQTVQSEFEDDAFCKDLPLDNQIQFFLSYKNLMDTSKIIKELNKDFLEKK